MHSMRAQVHNAVHVTNEARSRDFSGGEGGGDLGRRGNRDQIINVAMVIGHASSEDAKILGGSEGMLSQKNFI